nr:protein YgfX [Pseudomonas sp. dw_358]
MLGAYAAGQGMALLALVLLDIDTLFRALGIAVCVVHALWQVPRTISLSHVAAWRALRHDGQGWQLWSPALGWRSVQLQADSLATPMLIVLRWRQSGQWFSRSLCLPADTLSADHHRRLRVLLKFSRSRWAAAQ